MTTADEGTRPDFYSFRTLDECCTREQLVEVVAKQRSEGATWFRLTEQDDGVWVEGWLQAPQVQAAFDPPYVYADAP